MAVLSWIGLWDCPLSACVEKPVLRLKKKCHARMNLLNMMAARNCQFFGRTCLQIKLVQLFNYDERSCSDAPASAASGYNWLKATGELAMCW